MPVPPIRTKPKATVGHHFGALLQCPHRAWCDYFLDATLKVPPPSFLLALQNEGNEHEQEICRRLYPAAVKIPDRIPADERRQRTLMAMQSGAPAILQAYFSDDDAVGVADVLELHGPSTTSSTGFIYRVGEFKRATLLQTAHVLQAAWYAELLEKVQGETLAEVFFILGDGTRNVVMLNEIAEVYAQCKKELAILCDPQARPGPHLCRSCLSCPWRGVCVPELVESEHVSLLPQISRMQAVELRSRGIIRWPQLADATDEQLQPCQFEPHQLKQLRQTLDHLKAGEAVTRFQLRSSLMAGLTPISMEYPPFGLQLNEHPLPVAMWYEDATGHVKIPISADGKADLSAIVDRSPLAVYGGREMAVTLRLLRESGSPPTRCVDLLELVENLVHAPLLGLELAQVAQFVKPGLPPPANTGERLSAMRTVLDWMTGNRRLVA